MIKTVTAQDALQMLRKGRDVYYFDTETKEIAPLSNVLESAPGVFLVETLTKPTEKTGQENKPIPKNIDKGKVKALWLAGWSETKIADEMGVSVAAISYHIKNIAQEKK